VRVLDGSDDAFRASRGNFGLVWVQNKGRGCPPYARWTIESTRRWPALADELAVLTGIDVELSQVGGLSMCLDDDELAERAAVMAGVRQELGTDYPYQVLDARAMRELEPFTGPEVVGAVYCPLDGHVNPLRLLRALVQGFTVRGGELVSGVQVQRIEYGAGEFRVRAGDMTHVARRIVLAAGLGNRELAPQVGLNAPVKPVRGQILVSERMQPFMRHPTAHVRQTGEGVVQIGDSKEEVGLDDGTTLGELGRMARRATRCFPMLANVNAVRTWGALRVMTPDGFPIYQASGDCPGAFVVTCHSGITLAAMHAGPLVDWMRGGAEPADIHRFKAERFHVQAR
jgi:glycine/D-amino acid oxidase-like deaminating enzyme